jgi:hypothetical protein
MFRKIINSLLSTICFFIVSLFLFNSIVAMDSDSQPAPPVELTEELLQEYRKQVISQDDPPFFRLTFHPSNKHPNGKIVYILGSIHDKNPRVLLSESVYNEVLSIAPKAELCTEHPSPFEYLIKELEKVKNGKNQWNIEKLLYLGILGDNRSQKLTNWRQIFNNSIPNYPDFKINDVQKCPYSVGVMLFKSIITKKYPKFIPGFEGTLRELKWAKKGDLYLEEVDAAMGLVDDSPGDLNEFFKMSLKKLNDGIANEKEDQEFRKMESIKAHKRSIETYGFSRLNSKNIKISTINRNKEWVQKIFSNIIQNKDNLFIVCGNQHLKGEESFLMEIIKTSGHNGASFTLERIKNNGQWEKIG